MEIQIIQDTERDTQTQMIYPDLQKGESNLHYKVFDAPAGTRSPYMAHWHPEYEIILLLDGVLDFMVDGKIYHLKPNEALFLDSNAVHGHARWDGDYGHYLCFSFGENFLFPDSGSYIYNHFFSSIHMGKYTFTRIITGEQSFEAEILMLVKKLAAFRHDILKNSLSIQICLLQIFDIMIRAQAFPVRGENFPVGNL